MSLPPGFLDELRARVPISEIVGRRVTWDARKSSAARGDFWACCPFHEEKSPSFHVDDRKGFYHCFGCHASGDAIKFLTERENMGFMDAVEELARAAGMEMPARDPAVAERAEKRRGLAEWMEAAAAFYRTQLKGSRAADARAYIARRGVSAATQARFEIGYAPPDRRALTEHLSARGAPIQALLDAGLSAQSDHGAPYDRFIDRIIFPIRDAQGACIAFGGRAMAAGAKAKYLNSPQTPLFDKSRTLFNIGPAREAAGRARSLIVAEGYMDVIALVEAGLAHAVAPLGTAITEQQLAMMWRLADEPVIALDGDKAGLDAAARVIDTALPLLGPGKSLRFALLPQGRDPDDLIRAEGAGAMRAVLEAAEPLVALLWRRETEGRAFDSPERRAALDARLRALLGQIGDGAVRDHYRAALAERRAALFRPEGAGRGGMGRGAGFGAGFGGRGAWTPRAGKWTRAAPPPEGPLAGTKASALARAGAAGTRGREAAILLALMRHPSLIETCAEEIAATEFNQPDLDLLRRALISAAADGATEPAALAARMDAAAGRDAAAALAAAAPIGFAGADAAMAETGLREALARRQAEQALAREVAEAEAALGAGDDAGLEIDGRLKLAAAAAQRELPGATITEDGDEAHLSEALRLAIEREIWVKKPRRRGDSPK